MIRTAKEFMEDHLPAIAIVALVAFLGLLVLLVLATAADAARCEAAGGHISTSTGTGVGLGTNGGVATPVVTTSSSCLSTDGRIIENY